MCSVLAVILAAGMAVNNGLEAAPGPAAANEESLLRLDGTWEGTWEGYGEAEEYVCWRVKVRRGKIRIAGDGWTDTMSFALVPEGRGKVRVVIDGMASPGIYRMDHSRLIICDSVGGEEGPRPTSFKIRPWHSQLFTLTPVAPRRAKSAK